MLTAVILLSLLEDVVWARHLWQKFIAQQYSHLDFRHLIQCPSIWYFRGQLIIIIICKLKWTPMMPQMTVKLYYLGRTQGV